MDKDANCIAILGSGSMGWSSALALVRRGILPKIIDTEPAGGYASTGNQSWAQSGALYLAKPRPDEITAEFCREGYHHMMGHHRDLIHHQVPCYFLFHHREQCKHVIEQCLARGIAAREIARNQLNESLLEGSDLRYAALVPDHPFNNSQLLQSIAGQACQGGAQFYPVSSLETIEIKQTGNGLLLSLDRAQTIECKGLILACGAMIPAMLERLQIGQADDFMLTKTPVLVLRSGTTIATSMLVPPQETAGPNLVPFDRDRGNGVAICIPRLDQTISDYHDSHFYHEDLQEFASSLSNFYSGIKSLAAQHTILAHIYYCQKLHLRDNIDSNQFSRRTINQSFSLESGTPKNIFVVYPGKATAAPILAEQCVDRLVREISGLHTNFNRPATTAPTIAKQRYYDNSEYQLIVESGRLGFKPYF